MASSSAVAASSSAVIASFIVRARRIAIKALHVMVVVAKLLEVAAPV